MAETERTQGGGPQAMLRGLLVVVAIAVVAVVGVFIVTHKPPGPSGTTAAPSTQQVAMLDSTAIYELPEFKTAKEELEKLSTEKEKQLLKIIEDKKKAGQPLSEADAEALRVKMRDELQQEQAKRVTPLNKRVTAAIGSLAKENNYKVVLDKRIVVTGVVDITDKVQKKFNELKNAELPKDVAEAPDADSNVGYVNQETISELRIFKDAQAKLLIEYQKMAVEGEKQMKGKSPADKEKMRQDMVRIFQEKQAEIMKPVNDRVTAAITEVGKDKGLSLVLNSHHIMWGGRNLTDDVIKKLI